MTSKKTKGELVLLVLQAAVIGVALVQVGLFLTAALFRLTTPFPFEWVEQFSTLHALSMERGWPVYSPPSMEATSTVYTPGLAAVVLLGLKLGLPAMLIGRVFSIVSIVVSLLCLYKIVRREGGSPTMGALGIALFLGAYLAANRVYDMARVDASAIGLFALGLCLVTRHERLRWQTLVGVLSLCAATYFKQNTGLMCIVVLAALAVCERRKGLLALGAYVLTLGIVALVLELATDGWFHRWTWSIGASQPLCTSDPFMSSPISWAHLLRSMFVHELPRGIPFLFLLGVGGMVGFQIHARLTAKKTPDATGEPCEPSAPDKQKGSPGPALLSLAVVVTPLAALAAALGPRMKAGGGINGWAMVFFAVALCSALLPVQLDRLELRPRVGMVLYGLVLLYAAVTVAQRTYDPFAGRPHPRAHAHVQRYEKTLRALDGPVLAPYVPVVTELHGGGPQVMATSLFDLVWSGHGLPPDFYEKRNRHHWSAAILPAGCANWPPILGQLNRHYVPATPIRLPMFQPGAEMGHQWIWLPRDPGLQPKSVTLDFEERLRNPSAIVMDFEKPGYDGWTVSGAAFKGPAKRFSHQLPVVGYQGRQLANSFGGHDMLQGQLLSAPFRLWGDTVHFLIGGAQDSEVAAFELLVEGRVVRSASGQNSERLRLERWDVAPWKGKWVQLRARDSGGGPFGHILVDGIAIIDEKRAPKQALEPSGYVGWHSTGTAFGRRPAGLLPYQMAILGHEGRQLINSYHGGDVATGTLTSRPFVLRGNIISFLVGGSRDRSTSAFELLVDHQVVRSESGQNSEDMRRVTWDVRQWQGQEVQLRARDSGGGSWGHILVDDIVVIQLPPSIEPWVEPDVLSNSNLCLFVPNARHIYNTNF